MYEVWWVDGWDEVTNEMGGSARFIGRAETYADAKRIIGCARIWEEGVIGNGGELVLLTESGTCLDREWLCIGEPAMVG